MNPNKENEVQVKTKNKIIGKGYIMLKSTNTAAVAKITSPIKRALVAAAPTYTRTISKYFNFDLWTD